MRRIAKLLSRPQSDLGLLFEAIAGLLAFRIALHLFKFEDLRCWATMPNRKRTTRLEKLIWAANSATRIMPNSTCLANALSACRLFTQNGHASVLHIGVKRVDAAFEAHAWLECNGRVVIGGTEAAQFTYLTSWRSGDPSPMNGRES